MNTITYNDSTNPFATKYDIELVRKDISAVYAESKHDIALVYKEIELVRKEIELVRKDIKQLEERLTMRIELIRTDLKHHVKYWGLGIICFITLSGILPQLPNYINTFRLLIKG
jgi:hypothetical protein